MAVQSGASAVIYAGNNSTVTAYPVPFPYLLPSDLYVAVRNAAGVETVLQQGVNYTLVPTKDNSGNIIGGSVKTAIAYNNTWTITIFRQVSLTQLTELPEAGPISSRVLEKAHDKAVMALQQIHRRVLALEGIDDGGSIIVIPEGSSGDVLQDVQTFADAAARGNAIPRRVGQLGVQIDNGTLWRSIGSGAGAWSQQMAEADEAEAAANAYTKAYFPPGMISPYAGSVAPAGWLLCYGQAVSRSTYPGLFTAIGTTYGTGDGSSTFNVPDLRGRGVAGKDDMGGSAASRLTNTGAGNPGINGAVLGAAGGSDRHVLTVAQMPGHTHPPSVGIFLYGGAGAGPGWAGGGSYAPTTQSSVTGASGGGEAHPVVQPVVVLNYIMRT